MIRRMCIGYMQIYAILYKGLEYLRFWYSLVSWNQFLADIERGLYPTYREENRPEFNTLSPAREKLSFLPQITELTQQPGPKPQVPRLLKSLPPLCWAQAWAVTEHKYECSPLCTFKANIQSAQTSRQARDHTVGRITR